MKPSTVFIFHVKYTNVFNRTIPFWNCLPAACVNITVTKVFQEGTAYPGQGGGAVCLPPAPNKPLSIMGPNFKITISQDIWLAKTSFSVDNFMTLFSKTFGSVRCFFRGQFTFKTPFLGYLVDEDPLFYGQLHFKTPFQ